MGVGFVVSCRAAIKPNKNVSVRSWDSAPHQGEGYRLGDRGESASAWELGVRQRWEGAPGQAMSGDLHFCPGQRLQEAIPELNRVP